MERIQELFDRLHHSPELSGCESKTVEIIKSFLRENTDFAICDLPGGFYAKYKGREGAYKVFRADYDAVACAENEAAEAACGAKHLCGHDGHTAGLCAAAAAVSKTKPKDNLIFLFQSAEETGAGAKRCLELLEREPVAEIYGAHNLPGFSFGEVLIRKGTFALGSMGMELVLTGKPTHAAYPELGVSPAAAVAKLLTFLQSAAEDKAYSGGCMVTIVGVSMGEKAFGVAAAKAQVWATIRSEVQTELVMLKEAILQKAKQLAQEEGLQLETQLYDVFPATENQEACVEQVRKRCQARDLPEPMRWSEDFGHYLQHCPGAFFGIGAGTDCPGLHTEGYSYPVKLLEKTKEIWLQLVD